MYKVTRASQYLEYLHMQDSRRESSPRIPGFMLIHLNSAATQRLTVDLVPTEVGAMARSID